MCVPIMLCGKPYVMSRAAKKKKAIEEAENNHLLAMNLSHHNDHVEAASVAAGKAEVALPHKADGHGDAGGHDDHSFGELFIHQVRAPIEAGFDVSLS